MNRSRDDIYEYYNNINVDWKIAKIRNDLLRKKHSEIPSYCLWSTEDIECESLNSRLKWIYDLFEK